jgi:hypothetical protein
VHSAPYPYIGGGISGKNVAFLHGGLREQLSPNSFLIYNLIASATIESSPQVIDAVATGSVGYCELPAPSGTGSSVTRNRQPCTTCAGAITIG